MSGRIDASSRGPIEGVLFDLLMAVMDSPAAWMAAARDPDRGMAWRDAVTAWMAGSAWYTSYEDLVAEAAGALGLPTNATPDLLARWREMSPRPDAGAISQLPVPYAFVTNCSTTLADIAARRSGLQPRFVLSAEEAGWYKPDPRIYRAACRRLESVPGRTLFVAGAPYDAEGALAAGLRAILVARRTDQPRSDSPIPVVDSLDDVVTGIVMESQAF